MNSNAYHFFGFFISKEKASMKIAGIFDIDVKESISHASLDLHLSNIIFKKQTLLTCKVSSQDEMFKQVKSLDFLFDQEEQCYIAKVFADKSFELKSGTDNRIEKDSIPRDEVGIITIQVINKDFFDYNYVNQRFIQLEKNKTKRGEVQIY